MKIPITITKKISEKSHTELSFPSYYKIEEKSTTNKKYIRFDKLEGLRVTVITFYYDTENLGGKNLLMTINSRVFSEKDQDFLIAEASTHLQSEEITPITEGEFQFILSYVATNIQAL